MKKRHVCYRCSRKLNEEYMKKFGVDAFSGRPHWYCTSCYVAIHLLDLSAPGEDK